MADIIEVDSKMTLYFSKSSGEIKSYCTGVNNMAYFAEDESDYAQIWDYVVLDRDENVLKNIRMYIINTDLRILNIKQGFIPSYPIASQ